MENDTTANMPENNSSKESLDIILAALRDDYLANLPTYFHEMETQILALEDEAQFKEQYQALYRNVHSLKGSGGTHGLFVITKICHRFEDHLTEYHQLTKLTQEQASHVLKFVDLLVSAREQILNDVDISTAIEHDLDELDVIVNKNIIKILIVGQSDLTIQIISQVLKEYPVQLVLLSDGIQTLEKLVHDKFDMIFIGMELAVLNGLAVIAATRLSKSVNSKIPTILLTTKADITVDSLLDVNYIIQRDSNLVHNVEKVVKKLMKK